MRCEFTTFLFCILSAGCHRPCGAGFDASSAPVAHEDDGFLFDWTRINRVEIQLDDAALRILEAERVYTQPHNEVRATVTIDGETLDDVGVRLRGGFGSFQRVGDKPKWGFDFNSFVADQRFVGRKALALNNADDDPSYLRDAAGHAVYAAAGLPETRTGFAQVFVNGEDRGLYSVVEPHDDQWLDRNFGEDEGNLYDGTYLQFSTTVKFLDFGVDRDELFDLEEGDEVLWADVRAVSEAVLASLEAGRVNVDLAARVDWDGVHRLWAAEQWLGNDDGYVGNRNNFRVYFPPGAPMRMAQWDMDGTFLEGPGGERWTEPMGRLAEVCLLDPDCVARHAELVDEVATAIDAAGLPALLEVAATTTASAAEDDPRGHCDPALVREERAAVLGWFESASEDLRAVW